MPKLNDVEKEIEKLKKEYEKKVKELRSSLSWNKRFETAFNDYLKSKNHNVTALLNGRSPDIGTINEINSALNESGLFVAYNSCTFDNDLYNKSGAVDLIDSYDLSEYPVYVIFTVKNKSDTSAHDPLGYVKIEGNYSSYNGNEYNRWTFVEMQEITCRVFTPKNFKE